MNNNKSLLSAGQWWDAFWWLIWFRSFIGILLVANIKSVWRINHQNNLLFAINISVCGTFTLFTSDDTVITTHASPLSHATPRWIPVQYSSRFQMSPYTATITSQTIWCLAFNWFIYFCFALDAVDVHRTLEYDVRQLNLFASRSFTRLVIYDNCCYYCLMRIYALDVLRCCVSWMSHQRQSNSWFFEWNLFCVGMARRTSPLTEIEWTIRFSSFFGSLAVKCFNRINF